MVQFNGPKSDILRISAAKLIEEFLPKIHNTLGSINNISPNWQRHEMVVSVAFMTACNSGPLKGNSLEELATHASLNFLSARAM